MKLPPLVRRFAEDPTAARSGVAGLVSRSRVLAAILVGVLVAAGVGLVAADDLAPAADASATTAPAGTEAPAGVATPSTAPAVASGSPAATDGALDVELVAVEEVAGGAGGKNLALLTNRNDGRLMIRGAIQLNRIHGPNVQPVNLAKAFGSCSDCQTIAVAMQVNLVKRGAPRVAPQNAAVAINVSCQRCVTVAIALQYLYSVDDPNATPRDVDALIRAMESELRAIARDRSVGLDAAISRINGVIGRFTTLAESLDDRRDMATAVDTTAPTASPSPTPSAAPSTDPSPSAAPSSTPGETPGATPDGVTSPSPDASASPVSTAPASEAPSPSGP